MRDWDLEHPDITNALRWGYPKPPVEVEEEPEEATISDALEWLTYLVESEMDGDEHYKCAIRNLFEEIEEKLKYPASTAVRGILDMYEDEIMYWRDNIRVW